MRKLGAKRSKTARTKTNEELFVSIDYPVEKEIVRSGNYTVRISSTPEYIPEVSIDGQSWSECRPSAGYWWFDIPGICSGTHTIEARIRKGRKLLKKVFRSCECQ